MATISSVFATGDPTLMACVVAAVEMLVDCRAVSVGEATRTP
jgi:hypothetical protein